ncbi:MAG: hypothetical protein ACT4OM_13800, partial [Actinomycetota bacterium]
MNDDFRGGRRRDIHIIACERRIGRHRDDEVRDDQRDETEEQGKRYIGVRWASYPELGFPDKGYAVFRRSVASGQRIHLGTFFLPRTDSWANFATDAASRRPAVGPYFPRIQEDELGYLLPLIRLIDPRTTPAEMPGLAASAAAFFGDIHERDEELAWHIWRHDPAPPFGDLIADPNTAARIVWFYRHQALSLLMLLALRFEYAALFGLGIDDRAPVEKVVYEVEASWATVLRSESDEVKTNSPCAPQPPAWLNSQRAPGSVAHPAFSAWPGWTHPAGLEPTLPDGSPLPTGASVPRSPSAFTALEWAAPPDEETIIGYSPILYLLGRHHHAGVSPGLVATPPLPAGAVFMPLEDGEAVLRPESEPHYLDLPGMPWPPLEGHYHYEIRGMDLLGTISEPVTASIRHVDDIPPPAPPVRLLSEPLQVINPAGGSVSVDLSVDWEAPEDFGGPDVAEFRVDAHWIPTVGHALTVLDAVPEGQLDARLTVASLAGPADRFVGVRLSLPYQEHQIVSHSAGSPATMVVRRFNGRLPPAPSSGLILAAGAPTARTRVARFARPPLVAATVSAVVDINMPSISLAPAGAQAIPADETVSIYLHALRASVEAHRTQAGDWRLIPPDPDGPSRATWDAWLALGDPAAAVTGSPAIVYPSLRATVDVWPPPGFPSGLLVLSVVAVDDAVYMPSRHRPAADPALVDLMGNESAATEVIVSVRWDAPPPAPGVAPWDPNRWLWARSAAIYAESAEYDLSWAPVAGAVRYQVWRALEGAIPGATPTTSKPNLRNLAAANPGSFELRSDQVFGPCYTDSLPGRAPTRALYRVCAVNVAGVVGPPSGLIGPIDVPDIRQPPAPNLFKIAATSLQEADRSIAIEWTQSGPLEDVRFDIYCRAGEVADAGAFALVPWPYWNARFKSGSDASGRAIVCCMSEPVKVRRLTEEEGRR